ncbi:hypothetical protein GCM10010390_85860 [Streptomyces mordarskii]|uniref:Uncharacterized protein n=1 Tax=Streptomyces mordarskii TaxID=1226758 RepID=A0ABN1EM80_9ACTN
MANQDIRSAAWHRMGSHPLFHGMPPPVPAEDVLLPPADIDGRDSCSPAPAM